MRSILALTRTYWRVLGVLLLVELLSYLGWFFPPFATTVFGVVVALTFLVSLYRLPYGLAMVLAELVVGSKGQLFMLMIGGTAVSVRLGMFLAAFLAWAIIALRRRRTELLRTPMRWWWLSTAVLVALAALHGVLRGYPLIDVFLDGNGYLYWGLLGLFLDGIRERKDLHRCWEVFAAGATMVALKTLVILAFFSHQSVIILNLYRWVRDTRVFEVTYVAQNFYRTFTQSHIMILSILLILATVGMLSGRIGSTSRNRILLPAIGVLSGAAFLISFSRSMWIAFAVAMIIVLILGAFHWRVGKRTLLRWVRMTAVGVLLSVVLISWTVNFPYPWNRPGGESTLSLFGSRLSDVSQGEAAQSRWELLRPLGEVIAHHPLTGSGFGTPVTYISHDLRNVTGGDGTYTTYGFEWGYLDQLTEFGLIGLAVYLGLIIAILRLIHVAEQLTDGDDRALLRGLRVAVYGLLLTHLLTPYLGHPLGISLLMLSAGTAWMVVRQTEEGHG